MQDFLLYLQLGWEHIISLGALDHQLFLLALVIVYNFRDLKKVLILVTAFTIGHSITLALSVLDVFRIPSNSVEFLIPLTIVITSLDNIVLQNKSQKLMKINYFLGMFFGLIHGMGFANMARVMIAKEQSVIIPLLGFNIGLELGQIVFVIIFLVISSFFVNLLKIRRRHWILFISSGVFALALKMCFERIPF